MHQIENTLHPELETTLKLIYIPHQLIYTHITQEADNTNYAAYTFNLNNQKIKFRVAKITPTKQGQFVCLWKRTQDGSIKPYDITDAIDLFVISVRNAENYGQFVFSKNILQNKGIISFQNNGGKLGFRVYPPWDTPTTQLAKKTQKWQSPFFLSINPNMLTAYLIKKLYC